MKFILKLELSQHSYNIYREEYAETKKQELLFVDRIASFKEARTAEIFFTSLISRISSSLFKLVQYSTLRQQDSLYYKHMTFEGNTLLNLHDHFKNNE